MNEYLPIINALSWASHVKPYNDTSCLGIRRLQIVKIDFAQTLPRNINPVKLKENQLCFINEITDEHIIIAADLPFIVYQYEDECYMGCETNCSQEVIKFLKEKNQIRDLGTV